MLSYIKMLQSLIHKYSFIYRTLPDLLRFNNKQRSTKALFGTWGGEKGMVGPRIESESRNETYGEQ